MPKETIAIMGLLKGLYYKNQLLSIKRGNFRGAISNAKPLFMVSLINLIEEGLLVGNTVCMSSVQLVEEYRKVCMQYEPSEIPTPISKPYFHLNSEPFYIIKWKSGINPPTQSMTPSAKFLCEHVEYAALDDELWNLLQDKAIRNEYREAIINFYLKQN